MAVVATYHYGNAKVEVLDDYYKDKTPEEIEEIKANVARVCTRLHLEKALRERNRREQEENKEKNKENN